MNLKNFLQEVRISGRQRRDYKEFISSRHGGYLTLISHIISIIKEYICFSLEQKKNSYIYIYYNAADFPILTITYK